MTFDHWFLVAVLVACALTLRAGWLATRVHLIDDRQKGDGP